MAVGLDLQGRLAAEGGVGVGHCLGSRFLGLGYFCYQA